MRVNGLDAVALPSVSSSMLESKMASRIASVSRRLACSRCILSDRLACMSACPCVGDAGADCVHAFWTGEREESTCGVDELYSEVEGERSDGLP